jgi:phthalate 4,5-cis-dihydrodiol dehydrogenase
MINIGVIGAGAFGARHAQAIADVSSARVVAASRRNEAGLAEFTERFGGRGYGDYQDLLNDDAVDAVVIVTPHHAHTEIVEAAARSGKHILLEKPMALNLDECDRIIQSTRDAGVKLMLGHTGHFIPVIKIAKNLLESGEMGEVVFGATTRSKKWMNPERRQWHLDRSTGGGMWMTIGVHALDQLTWLIDAPVESVSAQMQTRFHNQDADDTGVALLRYANGATGSAVAIGFQTGVFTFETRLTCTKGMLKIDHTGGVFIGRDEQWQLVPDSAQEDWMSAALVNEWQAFVYALENDTETAVTGEFGRHIMAVAFAAEQSSKIKQEVAVDQIT